MRAVMVSHSRKPCRFDEPAELLSFERAYVATLPRVPVTDAHLRLERVRNLVAGRVPGPLRFDAAMIADADAVARQTEAG